MKVILTTLVLQDPSAKKPEDWVDEEQIEDPSEVKPDGWDQPEFIVDPEAEQPEDWDVEEDGKWEAPQVRNPEFKGAWKPKMIDNPDYKGEWEVRRRHALLHYCSRVRQDSHATIYSVPPLLKLPSVNGHAPSMGGMWPLLQVLFHLSNSQLGPCTDAVKLPASTMVTLVERTLTITVHAASHDRQPGL